MGVRMVDPGNIVHANDQSSIAILTQTQPSFVLFTLPAQTLDGVREAIARGAVQVAAYDRDNAKPAQHRHAVGDRQPDRSGHGHLPLESDFQ